MHAKTIIKDIILNHLSQEDIYKFNLAKIDITKGLSVKLDIDITRIYLLGPKGILRTDKGEIVSIVSAHEIIEALQKHNESDRDYDISYLYDGLDSDHAIVISFY